MSRRLLVLLCLVPSLLQQSSDVSSGNCRSGQVYRLDEQGQVSCVPCPDKTFMDMDHHNQKACIPCAVAESANHEVEVLACTRDSNTVIECVHTHFLDHNNQCKRCKDCSYVVGTVQAKPCTSRHDTVCCTPGKRAEPVANGQDYNCVPDTDNPNSTTPAATSEACQGSVRRENGCTAGEYLLAGCSSDDHLVSCRSCESGTFMSLTLHNETTCRPCHLPPVSGLLVEFVCNTTKDSVYVRLEVPPSPPSCLDWKFVVAIIVGYLGLCASVIINVYLIRGRCLRIVDKEDISSSEDVSLATDSVSNINESLLRSDRSPEVDLS